MGAEGVESAPLWEDGCSCSVDVLNAVGCTCGVAERTRVHDHGPWRPTCSERLIDGQLRGACLNDDGSYRAVTPKAVWQESFRADPEVVPMADRHYNRQKIGAPQFVPPGRCHVLRIGTAEQLRTPDSGGAFWVTSWPFAEYVKHAWAGAWMCSAFRNEGAGIASELIVAAIRSTAQKWPDVPPMGMVSFIDPKEVTPRKVRGRETWGQSWFEAGFAHVGYTKAGLWAFQMWGEDIAAIVGERVAA